MANIRIKEQNAILTPKYQPGILIFVIGAGNRLYVHMPRSTYILYNFLQFYLILRFICQGVK